MRRQKIQFALAVFFLLIPNVSNSNPSLAALFPIPPQYAPALMEFLDEWVILAKEAVYGAPDPNPEFFADLSSPMPVPFPVEGMLPPPGYAYAVLCIEGAGVSTLFLQKDFKGMGGHVWLEVYYSDGSRNAVSHNKGGFSETDLGRVGPRIIRNAFLFPEAEVKNAYEEMKYFAGRHGEYCLRDHNCTDALEVATNALGIPLPMFRTPSHETAAPQWLYKQFLSSPHAHRESKLINVWKNTTDPSPELREAILNAWMTDDSDGFSLHPSFFREQANLDPFPSALNQPRYGGIALNRRAELKIRSGDVTAAVFDPLTGQVILIGQKKIQLPEMRLDDLAVAFKSVYGLGGIPPADPAVSIDPSPDEKKMVVSYFGQVNGTQFGFNLFQADLTLKKLLLGTLESRVPGYQSLPQRFVKKRFLPPPNSLWRTWIVPEAIDLIESEKGDAMTFERVQMKCLAEAKGKPNIGSQQLQEFADHFTAAYDSFAAEYPIFQEMKRLAQITGVVKWLKENQIPIDLSYFTSYSCIPCNTPRSIDSEKVPCAWINGGKIYAGTLTGGILLKTDLVKTVGKDAEEKREQALSSKPSEDCLSWNLPDGSFADTLTVLKTKKVGNLHLDFLDLCDPGEPPLYFARSYDSFNDRDFGMGPGWTFAPAYLEIPKEIRWIQEADRQAPPWVLLRTQKGDYPFFLKQCFPDRTLVFLSDIKNVFLFLYADERWHLESSTESMFFEPQGRLTQTRDKKGITTAYRYEENLLRSIYCKDGRSIDLFYEEGQLAQAKSSDGKSVFYTYNSKGELEKAGDMAYSYDENHRLCRFSNPEDFLIFRGSYDNFNRLKEEKWGPLESKNEYDLKDQKIQRTIKVDSDMLKSVLEKAYGS